MKAVMLSVVGLIIGLFLMVMFIIVMTLSAGMEAMLGNDGPRMKKTLTPTQKFILAASSPTIGANFKCVIDIWETASSSNGRERVKELFEWGWGEFTYENAKHCVETCLNEGYNRFYQIYRNENDSSYETFSVDSSTGYGCLPAGNECNRDSEETEFSVFELEILKEMKEKYPKQGMIAWDYVRVLSIVGEAYMGGIMQYDEAVRIALYTCRLLQQNFTSFDDMVNNYTLGYQFWCGERKKDRLKYYKKLKHTWIYKISWNTELKEEEIGFPL